MKNARNLVIVLRSARGNNWKEVYAVVSSVISKARAYIKDNKDRVEIYTREGVKLAEIN